LEGPPNRVGSVTANRGGDPREGDMIFPRLSRKRGWEAKDKEKEDMPFDMNSMEGEKEVQSGWGRHPVLTFYRKRKKKMSVWR